MHSPGMGQSPHLSYEDRKGANKSRKDGEAESILAEDKVHGCYEMAKQNLRQQRNIRACQGFHFSFCCHHSSAKTRSISLENNTLNVEGNLGAVNAETTWILSTLYIYMDKKYPVTKLQSINLRL